MNGQQFRETYQQAFISVCVSLRRFSLEREMSPIEDPPNRLILQKPVATDQIRLKKCEEGFDFMGDSSATKSFQK
jgi:hypothetical protein